jgi:hypothetical protein
MASVPSSELLSRSVIALLADAAFVFAEPSAAPMPANGSPLVARLTMEHGETWELCVCVQDKLGDMLAANLLGTESETGEARAAAADAVGELANILAGGLAVELFGKEVVSRIGIPVVAIETGRAAGDCLAKATCRTNLLTEEGYTLAVALTAVPTTEAGA